MPIPRPEKLEMLPILTPNKLDLARPFDSVWSCFSGRLLQDARQDCRGSPSSNNTLFQQRNVQYLAANQAFLLICSRLPCRSRAAAIITVKLAPMACSVALVLLRISSQIRRHDHAS